MASRGQNYAVGIGGGAAAGAATGTSILPGWGTLIGGVIGAGAGAIGAAVKSNDEDAQKQKLAEMQARQRKLAAIAMLRDQAREYGTDTSDLDAFLQKEGIDYQQNLETKQLALQQRLDPNAFVGMAQNLARTSNGVYNAAKAPKLQSTGIPTIQEGAYDLAPPKLLQDDNEYSLDPRRYRLSGGFQ